MSGAGEILTYVIFRRAYQPDWEERVPYALLLIQLDEGPRLFSDFTGDLASVEVGARVRVRFEETEGGWFHPRFELAP